MADDPITDFVTMFDTNWSEGDKPIIDDVMNYRSLDLANKEYILLEALGETDRFLGLGATHYKRSVSVSVVLKTGVSDQRAREMLEECRRIARTKAYWTNDWQNVRISRNVNLSDRERKAWSYNFIVKAFKTEVEA